MKTWVYRFFAATVYACLLLCNDVAYAQDKAEPTSNTPVASSSEESQIPTISSPEQDQDDANEENVSTDFRAEDLAVQKRMAQAAEEANRLTKDQNWIGIIGLVLVTLTAIFACGAWRAGELAVEAANNQVALTTQSFQPTIHIEKVEVDIFNMSETTTQVRIFVHVRNLGNRPVFSLRQEGRIRLTKKRGLDGKSPPSHTFRDVCGPVFGQGFPHNAVGGVDRLDAGESAVIAGLSQGLQFVDPLEEWTDSVAFIGAVYFKDEFASFLKAAKIKSRRSVQFVGSTSRMQNVGDLNTIWFDAGGDQYEYDRKEQVTEFSKS